MKKILIIIILVGVLLAAFYVLKSSDENSSAKNYIGNSPEECTRIQVLCMEGFQRFDDESGCGCEEI